MTATDFAELGGEALFRQLAESTSDGFGLWDLDPLKTLYVNPALAELWGVPRDRLYSDRAAFLASIHPDDRDLVKQDIAAILAGSGGLESEFRLLRPDGEVRWIRFRSTLLTRPGGTSSRIATTATDVTEARWSAEMAARVSAIVESSDEAIVGLSPALLVTSWNAGAELLYGYPAAEAIDRHVSFLTPDGAGGRTTLLEDVVAGARVRGQETRVRRKDGSVIPILLSASPVRGPGDTVIGISSIAHDITERQQIQEALAAARDQALEASRLKSQFLATMSHEIRTPMNGVIGLAGLLLDTELDQLQRQYAEGISHAGEALLAIINDILDLSKIEAGRLELETVGFDVREMVEEVGQLVAEPARQKGLELLAYCHPQLPGAFLGDANRVRQVLMNLASNAVKFTSHGEVVIRAVADGELGGRVVVRFTVSDSGIGIAAEARDRLFEPFSQADASTTRRFGGTGLGLAISRQLVQAMGGEIGLESTPGQGSTFWFTVPLELQTGGAPGPDVVAGALEGLRALVVDDNDTNRLILDQQLKAWGARPESVPDGVGALAALRRAQAEGEPYAIGILDYQMAEMDGLELARLVQADPALAGLPLVLLSSGGDVGADAARQAGIAARLTKPVRQSHLYDCLLRVVSAGSVAAGPAKPPPVAPPKTEWRASVLVAEDNEINQMVAVGVLAKLGYQADVVANGAEAVEASGRTRYAAILMDCHMPELDGYQATAAIRARDGDVRHTPIIAMTAGVLTEDRERTLAAGMDDYVAKPVKPDQLEAALARWVPDRRSGRATLAPPAIEEVHGEAEDSLDPDRITFLRGLGPSDGWGLLPDLVVAFVAEAPTIVASIAAALTTADAQAVEHCAHRLRGAAANLGAVAVTDVCAELEAMGQSGELTGGEVALSRLEAEVDRGASALRATLAGS